MTIDLIPAIFGCYWQYLLQSFFYW